MTTIAVLPLLLGAILVWAASVKLFSRRGTIAARDAALSRLVGESRAPLAYRALGCAEAIVGLALITPVVWAVPALAAILLTVGFSGYLVYARIVTPESSCGCMSTKGAPISWRSFTRSAAMLAAAVAILWADMSWTAAISQSPATSAAVLLTAALAFVVISAEFDALWLVPLRRLRARFSRPLGGDTGEIPLESTVDQMQRGDLYRQVAAVLRTDIKETWDEDGWRVVCYGADLKGQRCTAVFAVPLYREAPEDVRVAFVDDETSETLLYLDAPPTKSQRPDWALPQTTDA